MTNSLPLVTKDQAALLKELGFDWPTADYLFSLAGTMHHTCTPQNHHDRPHLVSFPTVSLACMWLRKVKGVHVVPAIVHSIYRVDAYTYTVFQKSGVEYLPGYQEKVLKFDTWDAAQSAGLDAALEYLKKQIG